MTGKGGLAGSAGLVLASTPTAWEERLSLQKELGHLHEKTKCVFNSTGCPKLESRVRKRKASEESWERSPHYADVFWIPVPGTLGEAAPPVHSHLLSQQALVWNTSPHAPFSISLQNTYWNTIILLGFLSFEWKQIPRSGQMPIPGSAGARTLLPHGPAELAELLPWPFRVLFHPQTALTSTQRNRQTAFSHQTAIKTSTFLNSVS